MKDQRARLMRLEAQAPPVGTNEQAAIWHAAVAELEKVAAAKSVLAQNTRLVVAEVVN